MTAVTPSREALAKALGEAWLSGAPFNPGGTVDLDRFADALIASGAVVPLDTLADEARAMALPLGGDEMWVTTGTKVADLMAKWLAAALSERGDR
jgi:hypothetical protein